MKIFTIHEELLQAVPLHGTAKGSDIYNSLVSVANAYGGFEKCSSVVTDGAPAMVGRKTGLVGLLTTSRRRASYDAWRVASCRRRV